jgi:hypothetical protein
MLTAIEFLRRFFLHILPQSFVRIRHFGFLAIPSLPAPALPATVEERSLADTTRLRTYCRRIDLALPPLWDADGCDPNTHC